VTGVALVVVAVTTAAVFLLGHRSLLVETDRVLALVSSALAVFLAVGLYRGARVRKDDLPSAQFSGIDLPDFTDAVDGSWLDVPSLDVVGDHEGCVGAILSVVLSVVVLVVLAGLLWFLANVGVAVVLVLFLAVAWVFSRALRQVFHHSRTCRGRIAPSLGYAAFYSVLYTGWLFALVHLTHFLLRHRPAA
jgi:hypothetical protein